MKNEEILQRVIKEALLLAEITRYEREKGKDIDLPAEIKKLVSKSQPTRYAFTMTTIPKVGLNPKTSFNTPAGVYAYPLNLAYFRQLLDNKLPFQSDAPYCNIMKLKLDQKWLYTSKKGQDRSTADDLEIVKKRVGPKVSINAELHGEHYRFGIDSKIFDLTYFATRGEVRSTVAWTKLLRQLGYVGVYDPGNSVIHPSEPTQLVCLDTKAYEWVATYETRSIRKAYREMQHKKDNPGGSDDSDFQVSGFDEHELMGIERRIDIATHTNEIPYILDQAFHYFKSNPKRINAIMDKLIDKIRTKFSKSLPFIIRTLFVNYETILSFEQKQKLFHMIGENFSNAPVDFADVLVDILEDVKLRRVIPDDVLDKLTDAMTKDKNLSPFDYDPFETLLRFAAIEKLSAQSIKKIATFALAKNPGSYVFKMAVNLIAKHPNTPRDVIEKLPIEFALKSKNVDPNTIQFAYEQLDKFVRYLRSCTDDQFNRDKGTHENRKTLIDIASNPMTSTVIINDLYKKLFTNEVHDPSLVFEVKDAILRHPNLDKKALVQQYLTYAEIDGQLKTRFEDMDENDKDHLMSILANPTMPKDLRIKCLKNAGDWMFMKFFSNKKHTFNLDMQTIEDLALWAENTGKIEMVKSVLRYENIPIKLIRRLTNSPRSDIASLARSRIKQLKDVS